MADAVGSARRTGRAIASSLCVPVFLYGRAAASASSVRRAELPDIRRGGLPALAAKMSNPEWAPDFGPLAPHPSAGVTVVGARDFLIAFNVILESADVSQARSIAAEMRETNGGLSAVRALGLSLARRGRTQVSMNLLDYRQTSPRGAFAAVCRAAESRGIEVVSGELVGLVPAAAVEGVEGPEIGLERLRPEKILENQLRSAGLTAE